MASNSLSILPEPLLGEIFSYFNFTDSYLPQVSKDFQKLFPKYVQPYADSNGKRSYFIVKASQKGNDFYVKILLERKVDPTVNFNESISEACVKGHLKVVELLLKNPEVDPSTWNNKPFRMACAKNFFNIAQALLGHPNIDPSDDQNEAIVTASGRGHVEIVEILLKDPRVDPSDRNNQAIIDASLNGHLEVVTKLLVHPKVNPGANNNQALRGAKANGYNEVVEILIKHPKIKGSNSIDLSEYVSDINLREKNRDGVFYSLFFNQIMEGSILSRII